MTETTTHEPLPPSLLKLGVAMVAVGGLFLVYSLTVDVFGVVPRFTFDTRLFRWGLFAIGMVLLSLGIALTAAILDDERR